MSVLTEAQPPITVRDFCGRSSTYTGTYGELVDTGRVVLHDREGLRVLVDVTKQDRSEAIAILEEVFRQLKKLISFNALEINIDVQGRPAASEVIAGSRHFFQGPLWRTAAWAPDNQIGQVPM